MTDPGPRGAPGGPPGRVASVHAAVVDLDAGGDPAAIGAAITVELCGHWEHEGSCRWPHHTAAERRADGRVEVRTIFAAAPADEPAVRERIRGALRVSELEGPDGKSTWQVFEDASSTLRESERALAARLAG